MGMTVQRRKDTKLPRVFIHKLADVRGGVSVNTTELGGDFLFEGTPLSAPTNGICNVIKAAEVTAAVTSSATTIKVKKGHHFKVNDIVLTAEDAKAAKITAIDTSNSGYDSITVNAALGTISIGDFICQATAEADGSTTKSALKYAPFSLAGTGKAVIKGSNLDVDAWLIGVTKSNPLPAVVSNYIKGIINY